MTMTYPKMFSSRAVVEGFGEIWEFQKPKWWKSDIDIKKQFLRRIPRLPRRAKRTKALKLTSKGLLNETKN